ncbi:cell division protein FtsI (penicillin-binding protein 3) [Tamaricihabitans halophyticus]|uniref:Cell division protein FtsI (Penicillin-binding protein 3) n=1 Tax=Tamaricihabitans halophyticus TaxID=1262583 RepID=A0A4R2Q932_9PSEU|nr:penicillin-binding protein 2 [Tamaricihabitans halophyticus]TCP45400.1 cell division protein FtsI (penicillin-binding protein 3) [Tamaricihabitans halophyticus]
MARAPQSPGGRARPGSAAGGTGAVAAKRVGAQSKRNPRVRYVVTRILLVSALVAAGIKLIEVQGFQAEALSERAERQRTTEVDIPAERGSIMDRNGVKLAFSMEVVTLAWRPQAMREQWDKEARTDPEAPDFNERTTEIADYLAEVLGEAIDRDEILGKLREDTTFVYLVDNVEPTKARKITDRFPEMDTEQRALREYPGGPLAAHIVGAANWRMDDKDVRKHNLRGLSGLESARDNELSGTPGRKLVDTAEGNSSVVIPGTERDLQPATPGSDMELTIDSDLQYTLQDQLTSYAEKARARSASAVVMDAKTGEVYALANDKTFDPNNLETTNTDNMNNVAVTTPFEPGSVNKVITAAAALEHDITTPEDVHQVPGSMRIADHVVSDAWSHGTLPMTTTGIFAKSSNIGTLQLAQQVGEQRFADLLDKFGLGERTGIGLPAESPGSVPAQSQWSGTTFGNLPIGQGLSMTVLQMAGMYQAIANDGVRVPPRIVKSTIGPGGDREETPEPKGTRVVSPDTAKTVRDMLRAVVQDEPTPNNGTAPAASVEGYQISGKTGTAQQVDPATGAYSSDKYWITFTGILPADDPRFVVAIMLDQPETTLPEGSSAAPLFHDIASYMAQRYQIPLSKKPSPTVPLVQQ